MSLVAQRPAGEQGLRITLDRVNKSFDGVSVLKNLRLEVEPGEFLAIVGRSGSGKSSLLRLICGLDRPTAGEIRFGGGAHGDAGAVRMMFQEPRLLPWARVVDNVAVGLTGVRDRAAVRRRALSALASVGLADRAEAWPTVLSGGQKQRVALARALVSAPRVLLFDEPLGALDALTRLEMQSLVEQAWRSAGFTAVLVTHDVAEAVRLAGRIILIEDGTVTLDEVNPAPRPRGERTAEALALENQILDRLMGTRR